LNVEGFKDEFLTSKDEIVNALGITEHMFWVYIEQGMPALYQNRRWSASGRAIRDWWYLSRNVSMRNLIKQIREDEANIERVAATK
jgi:hypothetical protein